MATRKPSHFDILRMMAERDLDIRISLLDNVSNMRYTKRGTLVTIGTPGNIIAEVMTNKVNGGLLLWNQDQYEAIRKELEDGNPQT